MAVAAVVATGTGSALAAGTATKPTEDAWVQALAKRLGTTPEKLVEALKGASTDRIDALVAAGTITKAQGDALKARVEASESLGLRGLRGPGLGHGFGKHGLGKAGDIRGLTDSMAAAAAYLGITADALDELLDAGTTLATVVKDKGKTAEGLKAALIADAKKKIDASTTLTDAQKTSALTVYTGSVDALIESSLGHDRSLAPGLGKRGFGGHGHMGRGHGRHGFGGGKAGKGDGTTTSPSAGLRGGRAAGSSGI